MIRGRGRGRGRIPVERDEPSSDSALGYSSSGASRGIGRGRGGNRAFGESVSDIILRRRNETNQVNAGQSGQIRNTGVRSIRGRGRGFPTNNLGIDYAHSLPDATRDRRNSFNSENFRPAAQQYDDPEEPKSIELSQIRQYHHRQPQSGDQGIKPSAEKAWPDMWHGDSTGKEGQPQIGVSPFSESGRFVITGESKIVTHKKKKRYQFGGVTRVADVSAQDSHQTIARSLQVQAPPKPIPHYIFTDFVENSRNTNQLLNEFCQFQRKSLKFLDVAAKESYKNYSIMASVDGFDYAPAEAWKKKIAKEAASRNALKRLLIEYYGDMGDLPKVEQLKNMKEGDEKISRDQDHPTRYRPMPRIGMNELGLGLITLYPEPHEGGHGDTESNLIIGSIWEKMAELRMDRDGFKDDIVAVVIRWSGVFAARDPLVVSIATGSRMKEATDFKEEHRDLAGKWGRVLQDTSPWSLARRGLKRYLLHEASKFYTLQYENKFDEYFSIFEIPANNSSSQVLALKEGIEFVYFATSVPEMRDENTRLDQRPASFFNRSGDKLLRSLVLGLQGSLAARLMEPIYPSRILIGERPGSTRSADDAYYLDMYIKEHLPDEMAAESHELPGVYHVFRPSIYPVQLNEKFPKPNPKARALNWVHLVPLHQENKKTSREFIDQASGYTIFRRIGEERDRRGTSRLSKFALWKLYLESINIRRMKIQDQDNSQRISKYHAKDHRLTKELITDAWIEMGFGEWPCDPAVYELDVEQPRPGRDILLCDVYFR